MKSFRIHEDELDDATRHSAPAKAEIMVYGKYHLKIKIWNQTWFDGVVKIGQIGEVKLTKDHFTIQWIPRKDLNITKSIDPTEGDCYIVYAKTLFGDNVIFEMTEQEIDNVIFI